MNLDQAIQNIDILIQNTRMTRQEHVELQGNLQFLVARAQKADELECERKPELPPVPDEVPVEKEPVPVDKIEEDQDDSRTE